MTKYHRIRIPLSATCLAFLTIILATANEVAAPAPSVAAQITMTQAASSAIVLYPPTVPTGQFTHMCTM